MADIEFLDLLSEYDPPAAAATDDGKNARIVGQPGGTTSGNGGDCYTSGGQASAGNGGNGTTYGGVGSARGGDGQLLGGSCDGPTGNGGDCRIRPGIALGSGRTGRVYVDEIPTEDPADAGALWIDVADGRTLKVSAG